MILTSDGFLCVDKPVGPSSFSVVSAVRRALNVSKAGHAGTLDPMASGLLVVALGSCTRLLEYLPLEPKTYEFSVTFGRSTDTLDAEGNVVAESGILPSADDLAAALTKFTGEIEQIPPRYSAIKIGGVPAYKLARKGVGVEMKPRRVTIYNIEMTRYDINNKRADFTADCSSGTYVRSLALDIVKAADAGAEGFVSELRRTRAGNFNLSQSINFSSLRDAVNYVITPSGAFDDSAKVVLSGSQKAEIAKGRSVVIDKRLAESSERTTGGAAVIDNGLAESPQDSGGVLIAFDEEGTLLAVLKRADGGGYRPEKVFV